MRATLAQCLRYEFVAWRASSWPPWIAAGAVAVSVAVTVVAILASRRYFELADREFWAVVTTQGGPLDLPPMYGYVLAVAGVLAWRNDVAGDSAHVAYAGFVRRWPLAAVRTAVLIALGVAFTLIGAALSMLTRSMIAALVLLLVVPWIAEPLLSQVLELSPALHAVSGWGAYLPFTMLKDVLGDPTTFSFSSAAQLDPRNAAVGALALAAASAVVAVWRYCTADGTSRA